MKKDSEIQKDVQEELRWEATINAINPAEIGVAVKNGIVTLTGILDSYSKKNAAEKAAMRVGGVKAVADELEVKPFVSFKKNDTEIAEKIVDSIKWSTSIPENKVKVKVEDGWVTLEGEVEWEFQKKSAKSVIVDLKGVKGVTNNIKVVAKKSPVATEIKDKIKAAIKRNAEIDSNKIKVEVNGNEVILKGEVRSLAEKIDAENAACSAPGVTFVDDQLEVNYPLEFVV